MGDWIQLGDGECGEPWYKEYPNGVVVLRADDDPNEDCATGFMYEELDRLPRYVKLIAERDEALKRIAFLEYAIESWKTEEADWKKAETMLIQRLATAENLAAGILEAAINEDVGEQVSKALTDLALYGVTLG